MTKLLGRELKFGDIEQASWITNKNKQLYAVEVWKLSRGQAKEIYSLLLKGFDDIPKAEIRISKNKKMLSELDKDVLLNG